MSVRSRAWRSSLSQYFRSMSWSVRGTHGVCIKLLPLLIELVMNQVRQLSDLGSGSA